MSTALNAACVPDAFADPPLVADEWDAGDPRLPRAVRDRAAGFRRKRVASVALVGREYVLLARDGEVVDIVGPG